MITFKVILAEIPCAENEPTKYQSNAYIRVGTNLKTFNGVSGKRKQNYGGCLITRFMNCALHQATKQKMKLLCC